MGSLWWQGVLAAHDWNRKLRDCIFNSQHRAERGNQSHGEVTNPLSPFPVTHFPQQGTTSKGLIISPSIATSWGPSISILVSISHADGHLAILLAFRLALINTGAGLMIAEGCDPWSSLWADGFQENSWSVILCYLCLHLVYSNIFCFMVAIGRLVLEVLPYQGQNDFLAYQFYRFELLR